MRRKTDGKQVKAAAHGAAVSTRGDAALAFIAIVSLEVIVGCAVLRITAPKHPSMAPAASMAALATLDPQLPDVEAVAKWAVASGDAGHSPFLIVDKAGARVMAFEATGRLRASTPALLGLARGDDSVPGIGERKVADIKPEERITPAGRFVAKKGSNLDGEDIVWIDYGAAVSMHRVRATKESEQRLQRLASETIADNRISYGCINLPAAFYDAVVSPMFRAAPVVVYVLPETRSVRDVFALAHPLDSQALKSP